MLMNVILYTVFFVFVQSYVLPVEKCRLDDSKCLVASFQKAVPIFFEGIPELGVNKVDKFEDILVNLPGLQLTLKNIQIKGINNTIIDAVNWDEKKKHLDIVYHGDSVMKGQYIVDGKVLVLPIKGNGDFSLKIKNISVKIRMDYDLEKITDGKNRIKAKKYSFEFEVKDGAEYNLTNLFNGNKELGDNVNKFLNDNWKDITNEFGVPVLKGLFNNMFKNVKRFFEKDAIEDLAIV